MKGEVHEVWCTECGVWSVECEVRSAKGQVGGVKGNATSEEKVRLA